MFNTQQQTLIKKGGILSHTLELQIQEALGIDQDLFETKRHTWIYSPPGAGKTFTVGKVAELNNIKLVHIQGTASISFLIARLAVEAYNRKGQEIVVWIDDCDGLFIDNECLEVFKGILDGERNIFSYQKNLETVIRGYENGNENAQYIAKCMRYYQNGLGVEIPTDNMRFIITSNLQLPTAVEAKTNRRKVSQSAIRSRVKYVAFNLTSEENWGWLAFIFSNLKSLKSTKGVEIEIDDAKKEELLQFIWSNLDEMSGSSMRTVCEMAAKTVNYPNDYVCHWEMISRS